MKGWGWGGGWFPQIKLPSKSPALLGLKCLIKKLEMKLIFCMNINKKVSCKRISILWASAFPTRWYFPQSTPSSKFAISLQYLKKWVMNEVHFSHAERHQSFYKSKSFPFDVYDCTCTRQYFCLWHLLSGN